MNRIDRLLAILIIIQSKKFTTAEHLSQKFGISIRTVFRDLKALNEIGVPIGFEPNHGYFIMQGYFLPPVTFSTEEANALVLIESIVHRFTDKSIQKHFTTALNKVKAVLKSTQKEKIEQIQAALVPDSGYYPSPNFEYLSEIQNAIAHKQILLIHYQNLKSELSIREIEPIGMIFYGLNWHIVAWCWLRHEYRDFRVDRIQQIQNTYKPYRKTEHQSINTYLENWRSEMPLT
ncbi:MAG: YafY family transcriptional regulator [Spirosomaceae bacterium]|nr:YafY family transcriptional regulator [Spirosomataceae bacterium]